MASVYIETSIVGYLTARSRESVIFQAHQELTRNWWHARRAEYELGCIATGARRGGDAATTRPRRSVYGCSRVFRS